jgi:hypothetical protein
MAAILADPVDAQTNIWAQKCETVDLVEFCIRAVNAEGATVTITQKSAPE